MRVPRELKGKVGAGRVRGVWIEEEHFLSLLLWEGHHCSAPSPLSHIPSSVKNLNLLMQTLLYLLVGEGQTIKNTVSLPADLLGPKVGAQQVDSVFICDLYVFNASYFPSQLQGPDVCQSLPEASLYRLLLQWTSAAHPWVGLSSSILSQSTPVYSKWDFSRLLLSNSFCVCPSLCS